MFIKTHISSFEVQCQVKVIAIVPNQSCPDEHIVVGTTISFHTFLEDRILYAELAATN